MATELVSAQQFQDAVGGDGWCVIGDGACAYFLTGSFMAGARFVQAIGELPDLDYHHPDVDVRYEGVTVRLFTISPSPTGLSVRDVVLAQQISELARAQGIPVDPSGVQSVQVSIEALTGAGPMDFWRAVLGYADGVGRFDQLDDPFSRWPTISFLQKDPAGSRRSPLRLDIWVPPDQRDARIAAAIAAGGRLLSDGDSPGRSVLADPEGNEACIATWFGD